MKRSGQRDEAELALVLSGLGAIAAMAGARGVLRGTREVARAQPLSAPVDSEYRFYAAWYLLTGLALLQVGGQPEAASREVRFVRAGLWTAATGRLLSLRQAGRPKAGQLVLLGVEVALPLVLVPWQARVARASA